MKVDGAKQWVHVCSAGHLVLKRLHVNRGLEAMNARDVISRYGGVKVHDCWASCFSYTLSRSALCGSHLLRELAFIIESNSYVCAENIHRLLRETCHQVSSSPEKCLDDKAYATLQRRYRNLLTRAKREMPPIPMRQSGRRGKIATSDATTCASGCKNTNTLCCYSPRFRKCRSRTIAQSEICAWAK